MLHGPRSTGKTALLRALLPLSETPHALVAVAECIDARQLLERVRAAVGAAVARAARGRQDGRKQQRQHTTSCDSVAALAAQLQRLLAPQSFGGDNGDGYGSSGEPRRPPKFILALDGADSVRDAPATLLPGLARLHELVRPFPLSCTSPHATLTHMLTASLASANPPHRFPAFSSS